MSKVVSEELKQCIKTIYEDCMKEDTAVRERQIRKWRRLKLLWEGFNRVWYSEVAHDWRIWDETADEQTDQSYYDKPVNVLFGRQAFRDTNGQGLPKVSKILTSLRPERT